MIYELKGRYSQCGKRMCIQQYHAESSIPDRFSIFSWRQFLFSPEVFTEYLLNVVQRDVLTICEKKSFQLSHNEANQQLLATIALYVARLLAYFCFRPVCRDRNSRVGVGIQWILFAEHNVGTYTYLCKLISFIAVAKLRAIFSRLDLCQLIPRKLLLDFNWSLSLCANNRYLKFGGGLA